LPRLGAVELFVMFNPLAEYLTKETGKKVRIVIPKDFDAFKEAARAGNFDLGFTNSLIYV
jgi:ABC-type phosphate/phosphonate transport system substrate-binding protein